MTFLQNLFVKAVIVPIVLAVAGVLLESASALVKGKSKGQHRYRVWIRQSQPDNTTAVVPLLGQSIYAIRNQQNEIVGIDLMVSFDIGDFGTLGLSLIMGAFAVDISALIGGQSNPTLIGGVLVVHFLLLVVIVVCVMLNNLASPEEQSSKRKTATAAIGLGLFAMVAAFGAT